MQPSRPRRTWSGTRSAGKLTGRTAAAGPADTTDSSPAPSVSVTATDTGSSSTAAPQLPFPEALHTEDVFASSVRPAPALHAVFTVGSQEVSGVLDTGSDRSMIARRLVNDDAIRTCSEVIHTIGGRKLCPLGSADVTVVLHGVPLGLVNCLVLDTDLAAADLIIGCDALERHGLCLDVARRSITGRHTDGSHWTLYLPVTGRHSTCMYFARAVPCRSKQDVMIAPGDSVTVSCLIASQPICGCCGASPRSSVFTGSVPSAPCLQPVDGIMNLSEPRVLVCNRGFVPMTVRKGAQVGLLYTVADSLLDCDPPEDVLAAPSDAAGVRPRHPPSADEIPGLTREQRDAVQEIFDRHSAVFAGTDAAAPRAALTAHRIELSDDTPIYVRPRRMSPPIAEEVEGQCLELERLGIIERCNSAWNAPIVPIRKPNGSLRLCIDYRRLNKRTVTERFPMTDVADSVYSAHDMRWFSALDIERAYYQLPIAEESRDFTAFSTPRSHYRFRCLSFGLKNAPAVFQREMQAIFAGFSRQQLVVYLDDLLLMESSFSGHLMLVDAVLSALEAHGITLNAAKCAWFQPEVKFLGHQLSAAGLRKAPEYIEKVRSFPRPRTVQELRQFLGLVNFQRKFVPGCSDIARPLSELTGRSGSTVLIWTPEMTDSFERLKVEIERDVTLAFPDYSTSAHPLCLWVDASAYGAGACLTQHQDGQDRAIAYASTSFTAAQRGYSATGRELAALRWGVKTFHSFLAGVRFIAYTDHQALAHLHSMRLINHRVARTVEELAAYDIEIRHVPGRLNAAADMLSRVDAPEGAPPALETPADPGIPPGLILSHRPEGGGDSLVECLCKWMSSNAHQPAVNRELRAKLVDEALRSPGRYGLKLDRSVRQALRLMRLPGQPLAVELLAVFACLFDVRVLVHFGPDNPMTFCSARHSTHGNVHLQCLAGIHFNLLAESGVLGERNPVLAAYIVNEERARDGSDQGPPRRRSPLAQVSDREGEENAPKAPDCGHVKGSRCSSLATCNGQAACALLDSGAAVSLCSADALKHIGVRDSDVRCSNVVLQGIAGVTFGSEYVEAEVALSPDMKPVRVPLVIDRSSSFGHCLLLGVNFMQAAGATIDMRRREVTCGDCVSPLLQQLPERGDSGLIGLAETQRVPEVAAVREHQQHHRVIRCLARHARQKTNKRDLPKSLRRFRPYWERIKMEDGLVMYQHADHGRVPVVSRDWLVELAGTMHAESAHAGRDKLIDMITQQVFCPGATKIVADVVGACKRCQLFKPSSQVKQPPTIRIEASEPYALIVADLVMLPRSGRGHIGCLVVVDHASKFGVAVPIRSKSSPAVATAFEQRVLPALLRPATRCLTDNGGEFCGAEFEAVLQRWGIKHVLSTPLRAQGHGAVERLNRTLGQSLRMLDGAPGDWDLRLPRAMSVYNTTTHAELGVTPAEFLLGRVHELRDVPRVPTATQREWRPGHPSFAPFRVGERVKKTIEHPGNLLANKLGPRYTGPLTVIRVNDNGVTYEVKDRGGHEQRAHHAQLRQWKCAPPYLRRASERVRSLFDWTDGGPESPDEAEGSALINFDVPCGLVPQPTTLPESAQQQHGTTQSAPSCNPAQPTATDQRETPRCPSPVQRETASPLRPCLRSPRQADEHIMQTPPMPRTVQTQQVRFQLPVNTRHTDGSPRRSSRNRRPPRWMNDYVVTHRPP